MESKPYIVLSAAVLTWAALALGACKSDAGGAAGADPAPRRETPDPAADAAVAGAPLAVVGLHVDAARAPRDGGPLIAGEAIRVDMTIRGGAPPYRVSMSEPAIRAEPADVSTQSSAGVELAVGGVLSPDTRSGTHMLTVTVTDRAGATARAASATLEIIGEGAELAASTGGVPPPYIAITDAAARPRKTFVRGETVTVTATLGDGVDGRASLVFRAPDRKVLARVERLELDDGEVTLPIDVPRLAPPGDYRVEVAAGYMTAATLLRVRGAPFPPTDELTIDALTLRGGADLRAPRAAELERGERVAIEARVGGGRRLVSTILRLRDVRGTLVDEQVLGEAAVAASGPAARVFSGGAWQVPASASPGRYTIEIEVTERDDVSARYREVFIH